MYRACAYTCAGIYRIRCKGGRGSDRKLGTMWRESRVSEFQNVPTTRPSPGKNVKLARTLHIHVVHAHKCICICNAKGGKGRVLPSGKSVLDIRVGGENRRVYILQYLYRRRKYGGSNNFKKKFGVTMRDVVDMWRYNYIYIYNTPLWCWIVCQMLPEKEAVMPIRVNATLIYYS